MVSSEASRDASPVRSSGSGDPSRLRLPFGQHIGTSAPRRRHPVGDTALTVRRGELFGGLPERAELPARHPDVPAGPTELALGHAHTARGARHPPLRYRQGDRHGWPVLRANLARRARMSAGSSTRRSKSKLLQIDTECSNRTTPDQSWVRWLARGDETLRRGLDHVFVHKTVSRPLDRVPDRRHGRAAADATDPEDRRGGCRCCGAARCRDATGASAAERRGAAGQAAGPPVGAPLLIESQGLVQLSEGELRADRRCRQLWSDHVGMQLPAVDNVAVCAGQELMADLEDALHANVVQLHVLTGTAVSA